MRPSSPRLLGAIALVLASCAGDPETERDDDDVKVDTSSPEARRQYDANVAFALGYRPRCTAGTGDRPRVLVTGFGRFASILDNVTGRLVSTLVPAARYPETVPRPRGTVDPPEPQLSVGTQTLTLDRAGEVDVCAMVLPVYWDLAAILIAKELAAFRPSFVLMNGVAGESQPLWIELGAVNFAAALSDGSDQMRPIQRGTKMARLVDGAPRSEDERTNLLSWSAVQRGALVAIEERASDTAEEVRFDEIVGGAVFAGYPRSSNTYLCNNVTYVTGYLMSHRDARVRLLTASTREPNRPNYVEVSVSADLSRVPRVFIHWPSGLRAGHYESGASVMRAIIDAQITALRDGDAPTPGDKAFADPTLVGKDFY